MNMPAREKSNKQDSTVTVNGITLGVQTWGQRTANAAQKRPVLLLLHGFTGSTRSWETVGDLFESWGYYVIALDMLGHGRSSSPDDPKRYSIEHCQSDILAALQQLGTQSGEAILLGYSMGGRIALNAAFSGYFRALILESATPGLQQEEERLQRQRSDEVTAQCIEQYGIEAFVDYWERRPLFASQLEMPLKVRLQQRQQRLANSATGLANSLRGVGTGAQPDFWPQISKLTLPILLLTGSEDAKFTGIATEMMQHLPHAKHIVIPGAGHTIHFEQAEVFASIVRKYCQSLP